MAVFFTHAKRFLSYHNRVKIDMTGFDLRRKNLKTRLSNNKKKLSKTVFANIRYTDKYIQAERGAGSKASFRVLETRLCVII